MDNRRLDEVLDTAPPPDSDNPIEEINLFLVRWVPILFLGATVATTWEVVMRYLLNSPTTWAFELTIVFCAAGYLFAGGYVTQVRTHIAITALYEIMPPRVKWALDLVAVLFGIASMGLLAYAALGQALFSLAINERTGSSWNPPTFAIIKTLILVGACLIVLQNLVMLYRQFRPLLPSRLRPSIDRLWYLVGAAASIGLAVLAIEPALAELARLPEPAAIFRTRIAAIAYPATVLGGGAFAVYLVVRFRRDLRAAR